MCLFNVQIQFFKMIICCWIVSDKGRSFRSAERKGCGIKGGDCIPSCSELTEEELRNGVQCKGNRSLNKGNIHV